MTPLTLHPENEGPLKARTPRVNLNAAVRELAQALEGEALTRDVFDGNGITFRWLLNRPGQRRFRLELWVGYARCLANHGQMGVVSLYEEGLDNDTRICEVYLVNPDHERLNRDRARIAARQRMVDWLRNTAERVRAGGPLRATALSHGQAAPLTCL